MLARLFKVITTNPDWVLDHVDNYVELLRTDTVAFKQGLAKRLLAMGIFVAALLLSLALGGMALMSWAVSQNQFWILAVVPILFAAVALIAYISFDSKRDDSLFSKSREQAREDALMLKQAMQTP
jgi:Putative Actinobacterial Holin-X, holin superfamily III